MADYYVSAGTTTPAATHANIAAVNADAGITSGDNVYFYRGETFNDATLACDAGVTYSAYGTGADPIIDGVDTRDCITVGTANDVTIQNLELVNGVRCLEVTGTGTGLTVSDVVMRGSATDTITTECLYSASSGTGHTYTNVTIYQPHNAAGTSKGAYFTASNGAILTNVDFVGVTSKAAYSAIEVINNSGTFKLNNVTITDWNGRGGSTSRIVYLRGDGTITSTSMTVTDSDGTIYIKEVTTGATVTFDELNVDNITGAIQTESGGSSLTVNGGTWTDADTAFSADTLALTDVNLSNTRLNTTSTTATCDLTNVNVSTTPSGTDGIAVSATTSTLTNCHVNSAAERGIIVAAGTAKLYDCSAVNCGDDGLRTEGSAVVSDYNGYYYNNDDDGVSSNGTGSLSCYGTKSNDNGSVADVTSGDGYTSHNSTTLNLYGCAASGNWKSGIGTTDTSGGVIYNCTLYNNYDANVSDDWGIYINGSGGWVIKNCITEGHLLEINVTATAVLGGVTSDYNCFNNTRATNAFSWNGTAYNWADYLTNSSQDANSLNSDPLFNNKSVYDLTLKQGSPCIGTGVTGLGNYVGVNKEPHPSFGVDMGANPTTYGPFHPVNL